MPTRRQLANAIRLLSIDAVQQANSGHPGMPMGMADIAEVLWNDFLKHNPANPKWANRDRFLLSNGHGSMLQYSLLHLTGYDVSLDELKHFRQLHSKTPGHPEYGYTPGIEATTGPLGQGLAMAVGMALAERTLAAQFNRPNHKIIDHNTYVFLGDGCLMEGISHEACSFAGTLGLGKLIGFYDDNDISIDGKVEGWFKDDTPKRFEAYGWHVVRAVDGHDAEAVRKAILEAHAVNDKPSLICCKTVIGFGAPNLCGTHDCHGAPLGPEEIAKTRKNLDWPYAPFEIPPEYYQAYNAREKGHELEQHWQEQLAGYKKAHPELAAELMRRMAKDLPTHWQQNTERFVTATHTKAESVATRKASQNALDFFGTHLPELLGGSADLTGSNNTWMKTSEVISDKDLSGNYLHYGVREFGMAAIMNGIALHGGFIPYGGTFLVFTDYARNALRLSAMMRQQVIYVLSHDSIGLGEDGPTHQPIEHIASLRLIPNMSLWRPADAVETAVAWEKALERRDGPTSLLLTRQKVAHQRHDQQSLGNIKRGGYVLIDSRETPEVIIIATGSEVELAVKAAQQLQANLAVRVVSMPSVDVFAQQDHQYQQSVLPDSVVARVAVEAGSPDLWYKYVGRTGKIIGINQFGESAPYQDVYQALGLTAEAIVAAVRGLCQAKVGNPA